MYRESYGCDCGGSGRVSGRVDASMTDGVLGAVKAWTGVEQLGCPHRAFFSPFVVEVANAEAAWESGQMAWLHPDPSHVLVEGVKLYHQIALRVQNEVRKEDAARAAANSKNRKGAHG